MVNKGVMRQYLAATAGSLSIMNVGITLGFSSPVMEELLGPNSPIPMTVDQYSWIVSMHNWVVMLGAIPFGGIADRWGRRATLHVIGPMSLATWAALLFVDNVCGLLAVRFAQGVLMAGAYTVVPVYTGEIAGPKIRGALGTMFQVMLYAGIVFTYAAGMWLDFRGLTYAVMASQAAVYAALFAGIPETPHYYAMKGRRADARRSIEWLRGADGDGGGAAKDDAAVDAELDAVMADSSAVAAGVGRWPAPLAELFADPVSLRSLLVVQALSVFRIAAGVMVVISYASVTFAEMHVDGVVRPNALSLAFGALLLVWTVVTAALADRAGRRPLMIASSALCAAFNAAIAAYMYADRRTAWDVTGLGGWCVAAVAGLAVAYCVGFGSLFSTINCELFPSHTRAAATAVNTITLTAAAFAGLKLYPVYADAGCMYRNFAMFAAFSLASTVFCWLWLPETKGKTFAAIQAQLKAGGGCGGGGGGGRGEDDVKPPRDAQKAADLAC